MRIADDIEADMRLDCLNAVPGYSIPGPEEYYRRNV